MKLCLFGAGNTGRQFIEKKIEKYTGKYEEIFFVESNCSQEKTFFYGYKIKNSVMIDDETEVIITSLFWDEIYRDCCLKKYCVIGIYDKIQNKIISYKEMCRVNQAAYGNDKYIHYRKEKEREVKLKIDRFYQTGYIFENITEIAIMLSNLCNYAYLHKKCPAGCIEQKEILSSEIVFKILDELALYKFDGVICFHIYNEPLIDPRLFWFIDYIKKKMPFSKVKVYSNGFFLNEQMINELTNIGVDILEVTGYGEKEYDRLMGLKVDIAYSVLFGRLDDRLNIYDNRKEPVSTKPCKTFFVQVCIYSNGDVGLCCLDYRHPYGLSNIYKTSLKDTLNSSQIVSLQKALLAGNRTVFSICKNCTWSR